MVAKKYLFLDTPAIENVLYKKWRSMKVRCTHSNDKHYKNYAGRGIRMCKEWFDFEVFYKWAIENGYQEGLTIERIDVNDDYKPKNCTWITPEEQAKNRRSSIFVEYNNKKMIVTDIARLENVSSKNLIRLYKKYNDIYKAIEIAKKNKKGLLVTNKTGLVGVYPSVNNRWEARFSANDKTYYVGRYDTVEEALQARENAIREYKNRTA